MSSIQALSSSTSSSYPSFGSTDNCGGDDHDRDRSFISHVIDEMSVQCAELKAQKAAGSKSHTNMRQFMSQVIKNVRAQRQQGTSSSSSSSKTEPTTTTTTEEEELLFEHLFQSLDEATVPTNNAPAVQLAKESTVDDFTVVDKSDLAQQ